MKCISCKCISCKGNCKRIQHTYTKCISCVTCNALTTQSALRVSALCVVSAWYMCAFHVRYVVHAIWGFVRGAYVTYSMPSLYVFSNKVDSKPPPSNETPYVHARRYLHGVHCMRTCCNVFTISLIFHVRYVVHALTT